VGNVMGDAKGLGCCVEVVRYVVGVANSISRKCGALPAALSARGAESLSLACPRESNGGVNLEVHHQFGRPDHGVPAHA